MSEQITKWPDKCPITRRDFFMEIDGVPTYGGPYDSYTIPEMTGEANQPFHERELFVRRYDHDRGAWVEDEFIPLRVIHEDVLMELEDAAEAAQSQQPAYGVVLDAERYRWLRQGRHWSVINGIGDEMRGDHLDISIDATIAAHKAQEGK